MQAFYHPDYHLPLPEGHPFPMEKFPEAYERLKAHLTITRPMHLTRADLERVHCPRYLDAVSHDDHRNHPHGLLSYDRNRLGLPANPRLLSRSTLETAGTVSATLHAIEHGHAANLAGGTHHAFPNKGLGFCVLNDIAIAIEYLRAHQRCPEHILIVDTDAHQGNANNAYFRNDPSVFTYSIHVGKNYPAKKEPGDCDIPLPRWVESTDYLNALSNSLPKIFAHTGPDLVFWIHGADCHHDDHFGQMRLSDDAIQTRDQIVLQQCKDYATRTVCVYGGGYNRKPGDTGRLHAQSILTAAEALD